MTFYSLYSAPDDENAAKQQRGLVKQVYIFLAGLPVCSVLIMTSSTTKAPRAAQLIVSPSDLLPTLAPYYKIRDELSTVDNYIFKAYCTTLSETECNCF